MMRPLASNVLHINGKGGAKIANPFNGVKLQNELLPSLSFVRLMQP